MRLTVLGRYGPYPKTGGACSGYLVEQGDVRVLLDCGSGVLSRLQRFLAPSDLTAVVLSHLHADHMADALILRYYLQIEQARGRMAKRPMPLYLPNLPVEAYGLFECPEYELHPIKDGMSVQIGPLSIRFAQMVHSVPSLGMRIESEGRSLCYTGDTGYHTGIAPLARGVSLLLPDTGFLAADRPAQNAGHMTPAEVAGIAVSVGAEQLLMTHIWPGYEERDILTEAVSVFPGARIAQEGDSYTV